MRTSIHLCIFEILNSTAYMGALFFSLCVVLEIALYEPSACSSDAGPYPCGFRYNCLVQHFGTTPPLRRTVCESQ